MADHDVRVYGAAGNGTTLDTAPLQKAIDACHSAGGGVVRFPAGRYLTGSLRLLSGVHLQLDSGAVVAGSRDIGHYAEASEGFTDGVGIKRGKALITAVRCSDIGIHGHGTIDGQGSDFRGDRPMVLRFIDCKRMGISDITLRDSGAWVQHYLGCEDITLRGIRVHSDVNGNNDGINLDGCWRVRMSDCLIESGDDAFTLKSTTERRCRDITVTNCVFDSGCNGIKFGTESVGGFQNILISNCIVRDTRLCGVTLASVDGAVLDNVIVSNIIMNTVGAAFFIRLGSRGLGLAPEVPAEKRPCGSVSNITLSDIRATVADRIGKNPPPWFVENGARSPSSIMGLPGRPVENVLLRGIDVLGLGGGTREDANRPVEEKPSEYPQWERWGLLPAHGLYIRHARGVTLDGVRFRYQEPDARPAIVCDDAGEVQMRGVEAQPGVDDGPAICRK